MMRMLRACFDWRVITALTAVGVGVFLVAPKLTLAALPLLLVAVCPLSIMLMMKTMGHEATVLPAIAADPADRAEQLRAALVASRREQGRLMRELEEIEAGSAAVRSAQPSLAAANLDRDPT